MATACNAKMAMEYYLMGDFENAKQLFAGVAKLYRHDGWTTLLWENLGYLRDCARKLNLGREFIEYSLEMAALPLFSIMASDDSGSYSRHGPAGLPSFSSRKLIQEGIFVLLMKREMPPSEEDNSNDELFKEPIRLDIDPSSPLRMVLLGAAVFHDQTAKPGVAVSITVSLLSQLPCSVEIDSLEVQFNQPSCNFILEGSNLNIDQPAPANPVQFFTLMTNKWLRLTHKVIPGQSGKLDCISVTARIGKYLTICCRAESPSSIEDLPLWKFEDRMNTPPTGDPKLNFSGQKFIQVEEPDAQVDLTLKSPGVALVGEVYVVPVTVSSRGHAIHYGELKINLVDSKGGVLSMSPRETEQSEGRHVELLGVLGLAEDDRSEADADSIKKIQYSFGVVSVPEIRVHGSWSCKLEIKWHRPKTVVLYVSLGYHSDANKDTDQHRVNVHRNLQIEGKVPMTVDHKFMMPFRREPLLLSKVKPSPGGVRESLAVNEANILVVSAWNCSDVPLELCAMSIVTNQDPDEPFLVQQINGVSGEHAMLVPGEVFKSIFSVTPTKVNPFVSIGTVCLTWKREGHPASSEVLFKQKLPLTDVEKAPLTVAYECPPYAILGTPFTYHVKIRNSTDLLQEVKYSLSESQGFVFCGAHKDAASLLPKRDHVISYKLVPLSSGPQQLPRITITSVRYSAALSPSAASNTVFVYPAQPEFIMEGSHTGVATSIS